MTVKDVFDLRRNGRIEEAYEAIRPMYKIHHGKYTTLAMFWCAADMMKLLLSKITPGEATSLAAYVQAKQIYHSLQNLYPKMYDESGAGKLTMESLAVALYDAQVILNRNGLNND